MQWRMLGPPLPVGVDDAGRRLRPGQPARRARRAGTTCSPTCPCTYPPRRVTLTVNYRTPAEIMEVANRLLPAAAPGVEPARPVRSTGAHPEVVAVGADELRRAAAADAARAALAAGRHGRGDRAASSSTRRSSPRSPTRGAVADDAEAHRRADRGARPASTPRASSSTTSSWSSRRASSRPTRPGLRLLYVVLTRATPRSWSSCTPSRCPRRSSLGAAARSWAHDLTTAHPRLQSDLTAADVAWDLEPLVDGRGAERRRRAARRRRRAGADALGVVPRPDRRARRRRARRAHAASSPRSASSIGRAGSYAGLRFAVDTADPERGALMARVEERATAISNELLFFELEWAGVARRAGRRARSPTTGSRSAATTSRRPAATGRTC